jgi:glycosyltransferase involved in cell wall biosynthesis
VTEEARGIAAASTIGASADVSVVICAYTDDRWPDLIAAIDSVRKQTVPAREIVVVVDHNEHLLARARSLAEDLIVVENAEARGLSGARNSGVAAAGGKIVAFLDDDALAANDWLEHLAAGYDEPRVLGVGGAIEPLWNGRPPRWFPAEFHWVVGCTYRGMPETTATVRNLIGANMSFRRAVFESVGGFHAGVGRIGALPVGCEETELCIRGRQRWPDGVWRYEPRARVRHKVLGQRTGWDYFRSRCYAEGRSKAVVARLVGAGDGLASERAYTMRTLPAGVMAGLATTIRGDPSGLARAGAIVGGLAITTAGYVAGTAATRRRVGSGTVAHELSSSHRASRVAAPGRG